MSAKSILSILTVLGAAGLAAPALWAQGRPPPPLKDRSRVARDLSREKAEVREIFLELNRQMERLAGELRTRQPEDAERIEKAMDQVRKLQIDRDLIGVREFLELANFVEALPRQQSLIHNMEAIIAILEARRLEDSNVEERLEKVASARKTVRELRQKEQKLRNKLREHQDSLSALDKIRQVIERLLGLQRDQTKLAESRVAPDSKHSSADAEALDRALERVRKLQSSQDAVNRSLNKSQRPPGAVTDSKEGAEKGQIERLRQLLEDLKGRQAEAEKLLKATRAQLAEGRDAKSSPSGGSDASSRAGKDSSSGSGAEKAPGSKPSSDRNAGGKNSDVSPGSPTSQPGASPRDGSANPKSEDDLSRSAEKLAEDLGKLAEELSRASAQNRGSEGKSEASKAGERASEDLAEATSALREAGEALKKSAVARKGQTGQSRERAGAEGSKPKPAEGVAPDGSPRTEDEKKLGESAVASEAKAVERLKAAASRLEAALREATRQTGGADSKLAEQAAGLARSAERAAREMEQGARESGSPKAEQGLQAGADKIGGAAEAMRRMGQSLRSGGASQAGGSEKENREAAREAGREAAARLAEAKSALQEARRKLGDRSEDEKAADLQRKLAREAEKIRKEADALQRKLRPKGQGDESRGQHAAEAKRELARAGEAMRQSAQARRSGQSGQAQQKAREALQRLQGAKEALEKEKTEELARLARHPLKDQSEEQEKLERLTRKTADSLRRQSDSGANSANDQMSQGAESLDQASEAMEQAEQELADENPDKAAEEEEEALARLREAERKLRQEEDRLAALKQEQELRSVVMELIEVRRKQDGVNADARQFEAKRKRVSGNRGSHSRVSRKKLERLARTQGELAERVELLSTKLEEEVARVFAFILRDVGADMKQLQELLGEFDTGTLTDFLGRDVIAKIDRLLVSLKETMEREKEERKRQMQQQQQQQRRRRRLVTPIAELIMLKDMQVRVNRRTRNLENSRKAGAKGDIWERALSRLTQKQGDLTDMTIKIAEDFKNENEQRRREEQAEREGAESEDGEFDDEELSPEPEPEPESDESDL